MKKNQSKEKIGLHPVMVLLLLCFITIIISGVLSFFNVQATYNRVSTITGDYVVTTEAVTSLFNLSGLKYIFTTTVANFANFVVLSHLIIILLGIGIMVKSGFLKTVITMLTKKAKKTSVTYVWILICNIASIIGDLAYIIFIPLGALLFLYGKRNPFLGIVTTFASLTCGSALSIFLTSIDSSLLDYTLINAYIFDSNYVISSFGYILIMIVSIVLLSLLLASITENYMAKKMPKYDFPEEDIEDELVITKKKMRGLIYSLSAGAIYLLIFIYNIIPGLPFSGKLLDYSQDLYIDKLFSYDSFFSNGFVFIVAVLFVLLGLFYGIGAKTIKNNKEFIDSLGYSLNGIGKVLVMIFAAATFINIFKESNIGNVLAASLANLVNNSNFSGFPISILLFLVTIITTLLLPSPISGWSVLSSTVPTLMQVGVSPEFAQLIFRFGNAVAIGLTPIFAYFIVYMAFLGNYNQSDKPITLKRAISYQLPYALMTAALFLAILMVWYVVGMPLGVGTSVAP
ncbi:MAG: AbgT family transporter [Bacilli bacterium]